MVVKTHFLSSVEVFHSWNNIYPRPFTIMGMYSLFSPFTLDANAMHLLTQANKYIFYNFHIYYIIVGNTRGCLYAQPCLVYRLVYLCPAPLLRAVATADR